MVDFMRRFNIDPEEKLIFDRTFLNKFSDCLQKFDPNLSKSVDAQWQGFQNYSKSNVWKQCPTSKGVILY